MILFRPAVAADAAWVGAHLRPEDAEEVRTVNGEDPLAPTLRAFREARECYALFRSDRTGANPCAIMGVTDTAHTANLGIVWFLATDEIRGAGLSILREAPRWLDHLSRHYARGLYNFADARNTLHVRWCQLTGFTIGGSVPINGHPFIHIHRPAGVPSLV